MRLWVAMLVLVAVGCGEPPRQVSLEDRYPTPLALKSPGARPGDAFAPLPETVDVDPAKARLGGLLFYDDRLSGDGTLACSTCHEHDLAGTDGLARSLAPGRELMPFNSPTVLNLAFNFRFGWSGRFDDLGVQVDTALRSKLAMAGDWPAAAAVVAKDAEYVKDFQAAYPEGLTAATLRDAVVLYCLTMVTPGAPFDAFLLGEGRLSPEETRGYQMFQDYGCVSCHQGMNVGGNVYARFGVVGDYFGERGPVSKADYGLHSTTGKEKDRFVFRVPSLRNVAETGPYFHDGSARTLEDAVRLMALYQLGRTLSPTEVSDIVAFLRSLSGRIPEEPS